MKSRLRTYEQGFKDGTERTVELLTRIFEIAISDRLRLPEEQHNDVINTVNLYAEQILAGELDKKDIMEAEL